MIDRKKLIIIGVAVIAVLALLGGLIWLVIANQKPAEVTPTPTQTSSEGSELPEIVFTEEQQQTVLDVAKVATAWKGSAKPDTTRAAYIDAGMSETLARDYQPVWAGYFGSNITAQIDTTVPSTIASIEHGEGVAEGEPGAFYVGVEVTYEGTFHNGSTTALVGRESAIWYFVLDERTGKVIDIDQPMLSELNLPDPTTPAP